MIFFFMLLFSGLQGKILLPEVVLALEVLNVDLMSHERSDKFFKLIFVKVFGFFYGRDLVYLVVGRDLRIFRMSSG